MPGLPTVEEALALVLAHVPAPQAAEAVLAESVGAVLAEVVLADHDHPPFPRSKVDGWALRAGDAAAGALRIVARIPAGAAPGAAIGPGEVARIFTGAPVPDGADAVAMQERCEASPDERTVRVPADAASPGNIVPRGAECRSGSVVGRVGDSVTPGLVGALASAGRARGLVFRVPRVRIVSTGDELVPCESTPGPGKIRNSNAPALAAAAAACGARVDGAQWGPDDDAALRAAVAWALDADVVLLTGGVSVGDFDLVPQALEALGVRRVLHGVKVQPGKPLWFGVRDRTLVFGLPGNPVSALVNVALFVRPAVARMSGRDAPASFPAALDAPLGGGGWRRKFVPVRVRRDGAAMRAEVLPFQGSGDVFGFSRANALAVVREDAPARSAGELAECVPLFEPLP
jgi:molybdopterin molybdotransferase